MRERIATYAWIVSVCLAALPAKATETENYGIRVLPAGGKVVVDGKTGDWDLSGGVFICENVERLREKYALWFHAMYDAENVYLLARWIDPTPMNHPGSVKGSYGWNGDCLQVRFLCDYEGPDERVSHWTCWIDRDGQDIMDVAYGRDFKADRLRDAADHGARQAFAKAPGGYVQELAVPWKLIAPGGKALEAGGSFRFTVEANFTRGARGRITMKGVFLEGIAIDRIFAFRAYKQFGRATLEAAAPVSPRPLRLADARELPVRMVEGTPEIDWAGLIRNELPPGFEPVRFTMPEDGFVSLNLYDANGKAVRQLLTTAFFTKGEHEVLWDGLGSPHGKQPGEVLPAGTYTWRAIAHRGIGLRLRGWAHHGGSHPWNAGPGTGWGGNHGTPCAVATAGKRVYLGWSGAEGPAPLVACGLDGAVTWRSGMGGKDQALRLAVTNGTVYAAYHGGAAIFRCHAAKGGYTAWKGGETTELFVRGIWGDDPAGMPGILDALAADEGKLYLGFATRRFTEHDVTDWPGLLGRLAEDDGDGLPGAMWNDLRSRWRREIRAVLAGRKDVARLDKGPILRLLNRFLLKGSLDAGRPAMAPADQGANYRRLRETFAGDLRELRTDLVAVLDAAGGQRQATWEVPSPTALAAAGGRVLVLSGPTKVLALDPATGKAAPVLTGLTAGRDIALTADGRLLVLEGEPVCRVGVYRLDGGKARLVRTLGREGGRDATGPWVADALRNPVSVDVDADGRAWVAEANHTPKRFVVWDIAGGQVVREFFGPTHYGASGGAINPRDRNLMIGSGCEWRLDANTGRATCLGVLDSSVHSFACFREGPGGRLYLFVARTARGGHLNDRDVIVFERLGDGRYIRRAAFWQVKQPWPDDHRKRPGVPFLTEFWADADGDGQPQPAEVTKLGRYLTATGSNGWSLNLGMDMTLYVVDHSSRAERRSKADPNAPVLRSVRVTGVTDCGAPVYDVAHITPAPQAWYTGRVRSANPSHDGTSVLVNQAVAKDTYEWQCFDADSGRLLWSYPNPYYQVHGSHRSGGPKPGLFRGGFNPVGTARLPEPIGNLWVINTNCGEWHVLCDGGFYLTRLFNGDPFEWDWPDRAVPGAAMDDCPPGSGGEDFGGSAMQGDDGQLYIQAGKSAVWNLRAVGLDAVRAVPGGEVTLDASDLARAREFRTRALQQAVGTRRLTLRKLTPKEFTGSLRRDLPGCPLIRFAKRRDAEVTVAAAWDERFLYITWEVRDPTPWVNAAADPAEMYLAGDTVDFQLATDPAAEPDRRDAGPGDLRVSIGNHKGKPTAVLYRRVSTKRKPRRFTSGVVEDYRMDYVGVMPDARVEVFPPKPRGRYVVQAALPLETLGLKPAEGLKLAGDFGATHSDPAGKATVLRTHWNNQDTGLIDDAVFELKMTPANWGELIFKDK